MKISIDFVLITWYNRKVREMEGLKVNIECKNCKKVLEVSSVNTAFEKKFIDKDGRSIFLTYFDCPSCKERHYVQIDNLKTIEMKKKTMRMFAKLSVMRNKNQQIPKQQQDKFNKLRKNLNNRRLELMKQYVNTIVTDTETGEEIKLHFTIV